MIDIKELIPANVIHKKNITANTLPPDRDAYNSGILWVDQNREERVVEKKLGELFYPYSLYKCHSSVEGSIGFEYINDFLNWTSLVQLSWEYIAEYHHTTQQTTEAQMVYMYFQPDKLFSYLTMLLMMGVMVPSFTAPCVRVM